MVDMFILSSKIVVVYAFVLVNSLVTLSAKLPPNLTYFLIGLLYVFRQFSRDLFWLEKGAP